MLTINDNFLRLAPSYLFSDIARKVADYRGANPDAQVISMGIGDVSRPLCDASVDAMLKAVEEMRHAHTFHGYGPEQGYAFLRQAIADNDYTARGIDINADEIFISDGAKSDTGNIVDIFAATTKVALTDPVYPVYFDSNIMAGRSRSSIEFMPVNEANGFIPDMPLSEPDIIYLCYPNNPTGTVLTRHQLAAWVDYALEHKSLILFDAAYEAYITSSDIPRSIYEIPGARKCAIEFRSFSKTAGFTGLRCGFTVVPHDVVGYDHHGDKVQLHSLWLRRQTTKFNGASYPVQRAAEAIYTPEGKQQIRQTIHYYLENAATLRLSLIDSGLTVYGGTDSPYLWVKTPKGLSSWDFFELLLHQADVVVTPGVGFGNAGEGYVRLTAFASHENTAIAARRITDLLK
ncbi:MAG: LL-diaminopimelate aminotransferase [Paramuribaculum sp.]|nr:LL-diaminopimelate aminotransferase [Paramuribaculum sp.]